MLIPGKELKANLIFLTHPASKNHGSISQAAEDTSVFNLQILSFFLIHIVFQSKHHFLRDFLFHDESV